MKISDKTYILILFIMILGLSLISYWRFQNLQQTLPEIKLPRIETPEEMRFELDWPLPEREEKIKWYSPDNKLKLEYPGHWLAIDETLAKHFDQAGIPLIRAEIIFLAYRFEIKDQSLIFLIVGEIEPEKSLEEIIKETEANLIEQGGEIEITILEIKDKVVKLEITSWVPNQPHLFSKGKLIFNDQKTYLVILTTPQVHWPYFQEEAEKILNSVQILENSTNY